MSVQGLALPAHLVLVEDEYLVRADATPADDSDGAMHAASFSRKSSDTPQLGCAAPVWS